MSDFVSVPVTPMPKVIYGEDLLVSYNGKAVGHCTTHTVNVQTETAERTVKPPLSQPISAKSKFTTKTITKITVQVTAEGLVAVNDYENNYTAALGALMEGDVVEVKCYKRSATEGTPTAYLSGNFVISSLSLTAGAGSDATYSITLDNSGPVVYTSSAFV